MAKSVCIVIALKRLLALACVGLVAGALVSCRSKLDVSSAAGAVDPLSFVGIDSIELGENGAAIANWTPPPSEVSPLRYEVFLLEGDFLPAASAGLLFDGEPNIAIQDLPSDEGSPFKRGSSVGQADAAATQLEFNFVPKEGASYAFQAKAFDQAGVPDGNNHVLTLTLTSPPLALKPGQCLEAKAVSSTEVSVSFTLPKATEGQIFRGDEKVTSVAAGGAEQQTFLDTKLAEGQKATYTCHYLKGGKEAVAKDALVATTLMVPPVVGGSGKLVTDSLTATSISLHWAAATDNFTPTGSLSYEVFSSPRPPPASSSFSNARSAKTPPLSRHGLAALGIVIFERGFLNAASRRSRAGDGGLGGPFYAYIGPRRRLAALVGSVSPMLLTPPGSAPRAPAAATPIA